MSAISVKAIPFLDPTDLGWILYVCVSPARDGNWPLPFPESGLLRMRLILV